MRLREYLPGFSNRTTTSLEDIDDETLERAVKILEEQGEERTKENLKRQAEYLIDVQHTGEGAFKLGFIQDREEATVADRSLIAPGQMSEASPIGAKGYLRRGEDFVRILTITDYPSELAPGVLSHFYTTNENIRVTQHIRPRDIQDILKKAQRKLNRLWGKILRKREQGKADVSEEEDQRQKVKHLIWDILQGKAKLFDVNIYIEIVAEEKTELDILTRNVINSLRSKQMDAVQTEKLHTKAQNAVAPLGEDTLKGSRQLMQETTLSTIFPFIEPELVNPEGVFYGKGLNDEPIFFEPRELSSYIEIIAGKQGSGKSFEKKREILIRYMKNRQYNTYVLDPKADFAALAEHCGELAEVIEFGGDAVVNPLAIKPGAIDTIENPYSNAVRSQLGMYDIHFGDELNADLRGVLHRVIHLAYLRYGITPDPSTHVKPNPIIEDHRRILAGLKEGSQPTEFMTLAESARENVQDIEERILEIQQAISPRDKEFAATLYNGLESFRDGGPNANLNGRTNVNLDAPLLVFDMEAFADTKQAPLLMHVMLDFVYQNCTRSKHPDEVIADEVHYLLKNAEALDLLNLFARHHRHSNTRLSLMSQTADEFISDEKEDRDLREEIYETADVKRLFYHSELDEEVIDFHNLTATEQSFITTAKRGETSNESQCLMDITGVGKIPVTMQCSQFLQYVIDEDRDPWQPLIDEGVIKPQDVDWLAHQGKLDRYIDEISEPVLRDAGVHNY